MKFEELTATERFLSLALASKHPSEKDLRALYELLGDEVAWTFAQEHEMCGHVAHKLADAGLDVPQRWAEAHDATARRIGSYLREVDRLGNLLAEHGVRVIALKNAGIARGIYSCFGCSPMGDVDLLVKRSHFARAHELLVADGYQCASRNPFEEGSLAEGSASGGTEYRRVLDGAGEFWLELQWRPVSGRWLRPEREPKGEDLIARSIPIPGTPIRLMDPVDNLLQVCLHTAKHSYVRAPGFRLHSDVDRIVNCTEQLDWTLFVREVEALGVKTAVYLALAIPAELLGTQVPADVLQHLRPPKKKERALRKALAAAGLFHPRARKFSVVGYLRFAAMLGDDSGLTRTIFPPASSMKRQYGFKSSMLLPVFHARRLWGLAFRRVSS